MNLIIPTVTVAIPTYNEFSNIEKVIQGFLETDYPNLLEVLIADGGSTDGTVDKVIKLSLVDKRVRLLDNPLRIQSAALKLMLDEAKGDIFLRADAHCEYASNYIKQCVEVLLESKSLNVGGAQRFAAKSSFQAGVALASRSFLGSGKAKYRDPNYCGYADTVFLGCFWKRILIEVGGYKITRKEDTELNLRLLEENAQAIYVSSKIQVWYFPRKNIKSLWNQYMKYGRGCYLIGIQYPGKLPIRSNFPFYFISLIILIMFIDLILFHGNLHATIFLVAGFIAVFLEAFLVTWRFNESFESEFWRGSKENIPSFLSRYLICGVTLMVIPIAHFWGYAYQLVRHKVLHLNENYFLESGYEIKK
ncbi:glycosyl transferase, group 2 family protein [Coleofasciculus chthonoplastes PCC 7420]|uniref:Glycosyl transferase, group 2 family protein n=1 Tax=Coleofasciculus chthonoplastes PCC 7420 TaxID=118168 RepID=B4VZZ7_9CYAN|nr:glycosyltransferase family 2 protein [Coleofasciculus chthonoplastes]EDX72431.1 glycosyl transferase, group 2 family protein [Coleofasciculus chthonoplastes PCC 7420]